MFTSVWAWGLGLVSGPTLGSLGHGQVQPLVSECRWAEAPPGAS